MKSIGLLLGLVCVAMPAAGQATAFKTGEVENGNTKDCFYTWAGRTYVYTVASHGICPLSVTVSTELLPPPVSGTAYKVGQVLRGAVKDCYYSYPGNQHAKTVARPLHSPRRIANIGDFL